MDNIEKKYDKCSIIEDQYKQKYAKLLSMVNQYQKTDEAQKNNNLQIDSTYCIRCAW